MSPLSRCNPSSVLIGLFVVSGALMFVFDPLIAAGVHAVSLLGSAIGAQLTWRSLARAQLAFLAFAAGLLMVNAMSRPGSC